MHASFQQFILFAAMAGVGIIVLVVELFKRKLTWRTVWVGALIFPLYAALMEINWYARKHHAVYSPAVYSPADTSSDAAESARKAAQEAAQKARTAEPAQQDIHSIASKDGLVISFGSNKIAADAGLIYNNKIDTITAHCNTPKKTLELNIDRVDNVLHSQTINIRLNHEQDYRVLKPFNKIPRGQQTFLTFDSAIACEAIDMLNIKLKNDSTDEILIYRIYKQN